MNKLDKLSKSEYKKCIKDKVEEAIKLTEEVKLETDKIKKVIRRARKDATGTVN